jgi:hypothetical protein
MDQHMHVWEVRLEAKRNKEGVGVRTIRFDTYEDATNYIKDADKETWFVSLIEEKAIVTRKILFHNQ